MSPDRVFNKHLLGADTISNTLTGGQVSDLKVFVNAIDGRTNTFASETDLFLDNL